MTESKTRWTLTVKSYLELCKVKISSFSALSAATGYILAGTGNTVNCAMTVSGVFFLACGASALNQFQERQTDSLMERTKHRPLPEGKIQPLHALQFSIIVLLAGFMLLSFTGSPLLSGLAILAVIWYNGFYTWLKRKSPFAAVPGALIGTIPPAMGWIAGGGNMPDQEILVICFLFFMWQVPHFWLLILSHGADYEKAGLPSLNNIFTARQLARITFSWNCAAAVACLLIPFYGVSSSVITGVCLAGVALWIILNGIRIVRQKDNANVYPLIFNKINVFILIIMLLISIEKIVYALI